MIDGGKRRALARRVFALYLVFSLAPAWAALEFPLASGERLVFDDAEVALLEPWLRQSLEPHALEIPRLVGKLPLDTVRKLFRLSREEMTLPANGDAVETARKFYLRPVDLFRIRFLLVDAAAREVVRRLRGEPEAIVRLLGRDMNETYARVEALVARESSLSWTERTALLRRVKLVTVSRPIAWSIRTVEDFENVFAISPEEAARASSIAIVDIGYFGTLAEPVAPIAASAPYGSKVQWSLLLRSPTAPAFLRDFPLEEYFREADWRIPALRGRGAVVQEAFLHRFRVPLFEHQPKWNARSEGIRPGAVWVMLDVDDTLLKEVPIESDSPRVQRFRYVPSPEHRERYRRRLDEGPAPGKVVHFRFEDDGAMTAAVAVRPAAADFLDALAPLVERGLVRLAVTSGNDEARTRAVVASVSVGGRTLEQRGAIVVPRSAFQRPDGRKSPGLLRSTLGIGSDPIVAVDDLPEHFADLEPQDNVIAVTPWNATTARDYLEGGEASDRRIFEDGVELRRVEHLVRAKRYVRNGTPWELRLRHLAQLARLVEAPVLGERPSVAADPLLAQPVAHGDLYERWSGWKLGQLEMAAMLLELYPHHQMYFVGRDVRGLLYTTMLAAREEPEAMARIHELDLSTRSIDTENAKAFLASQGIHEAAFEKGKKILLVDVGFSGSIPSKIRQMFPEPYRSLIDGEFVTAANAEQPPSYAFLSRGMDADVARKNPSDLIRMVQDYEEKVPKLHPKTLRYEESGADWVAIRAPENNDWFDGTLSPDWHRRYVEDLALTMRAEGRLLAERRAFWRRVRDFADADDALALQNLLRELMQESPDPRHAEAIARDVVVRFPHLVSLRELGLPFVPTGQNWWPNLPALKRRVPAWAPVFASPAAELRKLVENRDWGSLWRLAESVGDGDFRQAMVDTLMAHPTQTSVALGQWIVDRPAHGDETLKAHWQAHYAGCAAVLAFAR